MTCEHLHKDGTDLASLAGGVLLEMQKSTFMLMLCLLVEILGAVSNLSKCLQKQDCQLAILPKLISSASSHLKTISEDVQKADKWEHSDLTATYNVLKEKVSHIRTIKTDASDDKTCLQILVKFTNTVISELDKRFSRQAVDLISVCSFSESFQQIQHISQSYVNTLCQYLYGINEDHLQADLKSFKFLTSNVNDNLSPLKYVLQSSIGYDL